MPENENDSSVPAKSMQQVAGLASSVRSLPDGARIHGGNGQRKRIPRKTEFYETAVRLGFYGADSSGLFGKKDNVRKYWEDIVIKLSIRPFVERLLRDRERIRVVDLGSGSGEGVELLTHIPVSGALHSVDRPFLLDRDAIESYIGLDISPAMIEQGRINYSDWPDASFVEADLTKGFPLLDHETFDLYFSSYASLSHVTPVQLARLIKDISDHNSQRAYLVLDLMGRLSPEWPTYWVNDRPRMLPYSMDYLLHANGQQQQPTETYGVCYWDARELKEFITSLTVAIGRPIRIVDLRDRSILVGRHMDTGHFNEHPRAIRHAVNRLFHRDYRGDLSSLLVDLSFLDSFRPSRPDAWDRIQSYCEQWNMVIRFVEGLMLSKHGIVADMIDCAPAPMGEELKMLQWLHQNATRFPVVDFWASVMGPQTACVLRNLELGLPEGLGCGHGMLCIVEIAET